MRSNMPPQKDFSMVPQISGQRRSVFNRSHTHKSTFFGGELIPFLVDEVLPGDSMDVKATLFARLSAPLTNPIMDNIHLDTFYFFVPFRILWTNWKRFMGEQDSPASSIDFEIPQVTSSGVTVGSLLDYMGIPVGKGCSVSSLYNRAYVKIWNHWFRDQNLENSATEYTGDGPETDANYSLQKRCKKHDYFTSCLPYPQKGATGVSIGITGNADVYGDGTAFNLWDGSAGANLFGLTRDNSALDADEGLYQDTVFTGTPNTNKPVDDKAIGVPPKGTGTSGLIADLTSVTGVLINDLRLAVATQQFLEINARSGTRYAELVKAHFGVTVPDYRVQEPEYLGGSTQMMVVNPVTQTGATDSANSLYQGNQAGHVTGSSRSGYSKSFNEHGCVIGIVNVRADLTYQQGIERKFTRLERLDFYFPTFANLGEQAVLNDEIWHNNDANDDLVFGYQERWAEYRYFPSRISGQFRSDSAASLDAWHLSIDFASLPTLNSAFIIDDPPLSRVLTYTTNLPEVIFDSFIEIRHARPMPVFSVPGLARL